MKPIILFCIGLCLCFYQKKAYGNSCKINYSVSDTIKVKKDTVISYPWKTVRDSLCRVAVSETIKELIKKKIIH